MVFLKSGQVRIVLNVRVHRANTLYLRPQGRYYVSARSQGRILCKGIRMRISVIYYIRIFCVSGYSELITRVSEAS